ncbi:cyclic nucleotide-binding domain-containing protein [Thiorhodovibrio frisius]|uniref:cAMP-binding protein n=1 Tax=Thiorhodovibrio frisius TaxID=631362 RepID=H8YZ78_9GAMM|nr:cyclic nucleotide-binding domain-containing protein [Thiorhodovibrio frisius]EIC22005.1 cAMP-binding protein [Thiorhodovibrio frisius]WPL24296.1 putative signal-transduction protein [Thiorhodovibrio frisius]
MKDAEKIQALSQSVLGGELDKDQASQLAALMGVITLEPGETLVAENEQRGTLFVLARGRLQVCKLVGEREETVYLMHPGECAGTRAFIDGTPRRAALRAEDQGSEQTLVLSLEPEIFDTLIEPAPRLAHKVMRAIFCVTHRNLMRMNLESAEMRNYLLKTGGRY